jgi:hypothetical protein
MQKIWGGIYSENILEYKYLNRLAMKYHFLKIYTQDYVLIEGKHDLT